jgi:hypothetical protein
MPPFAVLVALGIAAVLDAPTLVVPLGEGVLPEGTVALPSPTTASPLLPAVGPEQPPRRLPMPELTTKRETTLRFTETSKPGERGPGRACPPESSRGAGVRLVLSESGSAFGGL